MGLKGSKLCILDVDKVIIHWSKVALINIFSPGKDVVLKSAQFKKCRAMNEVSLQIYISICSCINHNVQLVVV